MAADYDQPPYVEKRVRFFDGQYLQDQDFIDEQKYHVDRQRRHNRTLHIAGIADGLTVGKATDVPARVTVAAGTAIDSDGRQLLLASAQPVDLPASQLANKTVNLYLIYREQPDDLQTQAGSRDHSRWREQPEIRAVVKGEAVQGNYPPVLLAELMLDGSGNITNINPNVRQYSGLRLPGPTADAPTLRSDANGLAQLAGSLSITGNVGIGTTTPKAFQVALPESSKGGVAPGAGVTIAGGDSASIELRGTGTPYIDFAKDASTTDYHARIRLTATDKLAIEGANVGIGTTDPGTNKLKVTGNTYLDGTLTVTGNTSIGTSASLSFGSQVRQMINLWDTGYGIGVQNSTQYFRTDKNFAWYKGGTHNDGELTAGTNGNAQMVIKDGNVGIGTTDPGTSRLVVKGGDYQLKIRNDNDNDWGITNWTNDNKLYFQYTEKNKSTQNMAVIQADGNVGIGTTGPAGKLDVQGSVYVGTGKNNENYKLVIRGPNNPGNASSFQDLSYEFTNAGSVKIRAYRGSSWDTYLQFLTNAFGANADNPQVRLHINHDGNVGIATTEPGVSRLVIKGGDYQLKIRNDNDNDWGITNWTNDNKLYFQYTEKNKPTQNMAVIQSDGDVGIGTTSPGAKLEVVGTVRATTFIATNPMRHRMYPGDPRVYQNIFDAKSAGVISKLGSPAYNDTAYATTLWNGRKIIQYGGNDEADGNGALVTIPAGYDTVWVRILGSDRWNIIKAYVTSPVIDLGKWAGGRRSTNCYCPDGSLHDSYNTCHQWLPIPVGRSGQVALISKPSTDQNFWLSGLAFSKNPWAHAAQSALGYHWASNGGDATEWESPDFKGDVAARIMNSKTTELRVPVVPSGRDKLLYVIEHNSDWNGCQHTGITVEGTAIERFTATYDNPFARHWNSKFYCRYIAARIPASLIPSNARYLSVKIDMTGVNHNIYFREIGTHDLDIPT